MNTTSTLVLGGARSGKSSFAEHIARASSLPRVYVATATAGDEEMRDRIARHRADRRGDWQTIEEPLSLSDVLAREGRPGRIILVDCLTLWLSNVMLAERDVGREVALLAAATRGSMAPIIMVSNEVGLGLVPDTPLGRAFRDEQGRLNQAVAAIVPRVVFLAAGLPLWLKGSPAP
jgi:adenosylcobinamide kinase/adenosylcobinamide-phosphate guanylyltransferase